jgi:hypothetical protein
LAQATWVQGILAQATSTRAILFRALPIYAPRAVACVSPFA